MYEEVCISVDGIDLDGVLTDSVQNKGIIIFSHGSGSSRFSTRNRYVAEQLNENGFHTLLFDLLTAEEDEDYGNRFDISLLTQRLISVVNWVHKNPKYSGLHTGLFGASTGAASALDAAAELGYERIKAVVSRGGRPDLAKRIDEVSSPTLLLVGGLDQEVLELNKKAFTELNSIRELTVIPGATHLFEEAGKMQEVTDHAMDWFNRHLKEPAQLEKDYLE